VIAAASVSLWRVKARNCWRLLALRTPVVTTVPGEATAVAWAQHGQPRRLTAARRLDVVRLQFDSRTEIPSTGLFGLSTRRLTPHIYESHEIEALLSAATRLPCPNGVRGATYATLFGLLAATVCASLRRCHFSVATSILPTACLRSKKPNLANRAWFPCTPVPRVRS
jgi:hypothetical protein